MTEENDKRYESVDAYFGSSVESIYGPYQHRPRGLDKTDVEKAREAANQDPNVKEVLEYDFEKGGKLLVYANHKDHVTKVSFFQNGALKSDGQPTPDTPSDIRETLRGAGLIPRI